MINHRLILGLGNTHQNMKMRTPYGRTLDSENNAYKQCQDYLCPSESKIQEWFPSSLEARIRAKGAFFKNKE